MSEFEFLRNVTIGQYLPTGSPIHRLDARARILCAVIILAALTFSPNLQGLVLGFGIILLLLFVAKVPLGFALRGLLPPLPFLMLLALLQVLFNPLPEDSHLIFNLGAVTVTVADLLAGSRLLARFATLVLGLSLTSFCISTSEMIRGLELLLAPLRRVGVPTHDLVLIVQVTLRFIPFLAQAAERIAKAQASRGAGWGVGRGNPVQRARQVLPLLVPLFLNGLRRAENLALAMEARGYGSGVLPTPLTEMRFDFKDVLAIGVSLVVTAAVVLV